MVQFEKEKGNVNDDDDDDDDKILPISVKNAVGGLEIFINYFEQQDDSKFNVNDLQIFKKYLRIVRVQEFNSKSQSTLDVFLEG